LRKGVLTVSARVRNLRFVLLKLYGVLLALALAGWSTLARVEAEDCAEDLVFPPGEVVDGKTAGEWSARFWDWALRIPKRGHPMLESTGQFCSLEQNEPVFFLSGAVVGSTPQEGPRDACVVPCGRPIQVMIYSIIGWAPGDCDDAVKLDTECRDLIRGIVDGIVARQLIVDGRSIECLEDHRAVSPLFDSTMPEENLFDISPPLTRTFVAEGYYVTLRANALAPGPHTIEWVALREGEQLPLLRYAPLTVEPCDASAFRRGDSDGNGVVNVTDAVTVLGRLFRGEDPLPCDDAADGNDDGGLNITDAVFILEHLFRSGPAPPAPGPADCGTDPTEDALGCTKAC
jgi:hypothetical protein